ncbi:MAG: hypothetical protein Q9159_007449 [Coniocarpon cinnabarinum]
MKLTVRSFLPYTINFDTKASSSGDVTPPRRSTDSPAPIVTAKPPTLLPTDTPPRSPDDPTTPFGRSLPLHSPALHFVKPNDPRTLTRQDSFAPEWGQGKIFNQPRSKGLDVPPSTILEYAKAQEEAAAKEIGRLQTHKSRTLAHIDGNITPARTPSHEKGSLQSGWNVAPAVHGNGALTNALQAASADSIAGEGIHHFGTLGFPTDGLSKHKRDEISDFLDGGYDAHAVFVKDADFDGHYTHFCKTILWPVFNYVIPDHPKSKAYADHSWKYYVKINEAFAKAILRSYKRGDTIWIHDYHLLLVPKMLRKQLPDARIGFFMHNAFPSSEIFRCLAMRDELLEGILGANIVMFQVEEYAYHFRQTCSRLLQVEATERGVQIEDRFIEVSAVPIGTVRGKLYHARMEPEVSKWVQTLLKKYQGKKIIASHDKLDSLRGIKQKLQAYEIFLENNPQWRHKVVLLQVVTAAAQEDKDLDAAISDIVTRLNAKYSTLAHSPIVFLRQELAFTQYLALLTIADVLMVTPLRDGMNLTCHDYVECQDGRGLEDKKHGSLILSEFTGSSEIFRGNEIAVNPWDIPQMARAIKFALNVRPEERERRYKALSEIVDRHDGSRWAAEMLRQLNTAYEAHQLRDAHSVPRLPVNQLSTKYQTSAKRLFVLDYEGTLDDSDTSGDRTASPSGRIIETLQDLIAASDDNVVYVSSQKPMRQLEEMFSQIPDLGLIAENGCFVRPFGRDESLSLAGKLDSGKGEWKDGILRSLRYYNERIEGTSIEERQCTILFHYDKVASHDAAIAERHAGEMANHINEGCQVQRVKAVPTQKAVIIQPADVDKVTACEWILADMQNPQSQRSRRGTAASSTTEDYFTGSPPNAPAGMEESTLLSPVSSNEGLASAKDPNPESVTPKAANLSADFLRSHENPLGVRSGAPEFLFVAGDGREDEPVYVWANQLRAAEGKAVHKNAIANVFSVCVGKRNTEAAYTLTQGASGEYCFPVLLRDV